MSGCPARPPPSPSPTWRSAISSPAGIGTYAYLASGSGHAPAERDVAGTIVGLTYDANGNMTTSYDGRTMTYDGENRPLSVITAGGVRTEYHYAPDGTRLWKVEQIGTPNETTTVTIGPIEVRNYQYGGLHTAADVLVTPHGNVRRAMDGTYSYLHRDQLGSVRAITDAAGTHAKQSIYKPFGTVTDWDPQRRSDPFKPRASSANAMTPMLADAMIAANSGNSRVAVFGNKNGL